MVSASSVTSDTAISFGGSMPGREMIGGGVLARGQAGLEDIFKCGEGEDHAFTVSRDSYEVQQKCMWRCIYEVYHEASSVNLHEDLKESVPLKVPQCFLLCPYLISSPLDHICISRPVLGLWKHEHALMQICTINKHHQEIFQEKSVQLKENNGRH